MSAKQRARSGWIRALNALSTSCALAGALCACTSACGGSAPAAQVDASQFDAARAWKLLEEQVALGPRPAGSEAVERTRALIERELSAAGLTPVRERFTAQTPAGETAMANVYADLAASGPQPEQSPLVLIASHFDTKKVDFPFVGANDGASSTAVLLELARVLAAAGPREVGYRFVFFDGEEAVRFHWEDPDNCYGSRHHAAELKRKGELGRVRALILLDLIGDRDLHLTRDSYSSARLVEIFFGAARANGLGQHVDGPTLAVKDDHQPFLSAGVESIDLIDFNYGPDNSWWHTADDTPDKCSQESLSAVGRIVLLGLGGLEHYVTSRK
jgi:Peptidase family M28